MALGEQRDMIGGSLLAIFGLAFTWYTLQHYDLGTPNNMGPGMFPTALGVLLAALGATISIIAFFRREPFGEIRIQVPIFVLAGIGVFAVLLPSFGLLPAIVGVTLISSFADEKLHVTGTILLCAALCLIAWLVFDVGLSMAVAMFRWPF